MQAETTATEEVAAGAADDSAQVRAVFLVVDKVRDREHERYGDDMLHVFSLQRREHTSTQKHTKYHTYIHACVHV